MGDGKRYMGVFLLSLLMFSVVGMSPLQGATGHGVNIIIDGPTDVFVNETQEYEVKVGGTFANNADNWTLTSSVDGPGVVRPKEQRSTESQTFSINLTVTEENEVTLILNATAGGDNQTRRTSTELKVKGLKPVTSTLSFKNPTDLTLTDVELGIFIDGKLERTVQVSPIEPRSTRNMKVNWSKEGLDPGEHKMEVWVDYGYTEGDRFVKNEKIYTVRFYIEGESTLEKYGWAIGIGVVAAGLGIFYYLRRRKKRRRPW